MPGIVTLRRMEFETYTIALLVTNPDAPELDEGEAARLQDAHLSHLAALHAAGHLVALGPLPDPDGELPGLCTLPADPGPARGLEGAGPAGRAGRLAPAVM